MTPLNDAQTIDVGVWINSLDAADQRRLIFLAVTNHPVRFSNAQEVADRWFNILSTQGYAKLCKHARKWLAQEYAKLKEAQAA